MVQHPIFVVQEADDNLSRQKWVFVLEGSNLVLDRYYVEVLEEGTWRVSHFYDRGDPEGGYGTWTWLTEDEVPFDTELKAEALSELVSRLLVMKESKK
jgi:hypothetical protein